MMKLNSRAKPFSIVDALAYAERALCAAPARSTVRREPPAGELVCRFALPLKLCPTGNSMRHRPPWMLGDIKNKCLVVMRAQMVAFAALPLGGRPQVRCVRFTARRPDRYSDWAKIPVDCLVKLGVLTNDDEESINLFQWSEPAKVKDGCVLIEVRTGRPDGSP